MTEVPKVSVVVPVYNCAGYLPRCLDSILRQTLTGLEIILVNDGSTDGSLEICRSYEERFPNVRVLSQANSGAEAARKNGIAAATGEYIGFVDSDDWVDVDMFNVLYERSVQSHADIAQCGFVKTDSATPLLCAVSPAGTFAVSPARRALLQMFGCLHGGDFSFTLWGKLFRRSLFDRLELPVRPCMINDVQVVARVFGRAETAVSLDARLYYYFSRNNQNDKSTMDLVYDDESRLIQSHIEAFSDVSGYFKPLDRELYLASLKHTVSWSLSALIRRNISPECKALARKTIRSSQVWGNPCIPWKKKIAALIVQIFQER